ncbi:MAG: DUF6273 domain-containing protein [Lachnospiraceae bacterium]
MDKTHYGKKNPLGILEQNFEKAFYWWSRAEQGDKENALKHKLGLEYMRQFQELAKIRKELEYNKTIINELEKKLESVRKIEKIQVGKVIKFGKNNREWIVLDKKEGKALIFAKESIGEGPYNGEEINITWEGCLLRKWLNEEFYYNFFDEGEKNQICEVLVKNFSNPKYGTWGGNDTMDKIFLLSIGEAEKYFENNKARAIGSWWWLRSPGYCSGNIAVVSSDGVILPNGINTYSRRSIRPALWIYLEY